MSDPFLITGPAVISFSGGRTSAYMLWRILQAHGGTLPDDVVACFANTGREMLATLDFVNECATHWGVHVVWLEYRRNPETGRTWTEVVSHNSASREGEPFEMMLGGKRMLPNPVMRFCTVELKIRQMSNYCRALGWKRWTNIVGLRRDEGGRYERAKKRNAAKKDRFIAAAPLYEAGIEELDVLRFWRAQPFDLKLAGPWEGNCDGCFLKGMARINRMFLDHPDRMAWWVAQESKDRGPGRGASFRHGRPRYEVLAKLVRDYPRLSQLDDLHESDLSCLDAACGV